MRRRWPWVAAAVLLLPVLAAAVGGWVLLNGDALRARVEAAVTEATGRRFALGGPVRLKLSLVPTAVLEEPRLANAPGGSRADMFAARRVEASVALLPLLSRRVEVRSIAVEAPDLLLERTVDGRPNWVFERAPRPEAVPQAPAGPATAREPFALDLRAATLSGGQLTWRDARSGVTETLSLPRLSLRAGAGDALLAEGELAARGVPFALRAEGGSLAALRAGDAPWPASASLAADGLGASATGALRNGAWSGRVSLSADTAARLAPLLPSGTALPDARGLTLDTGLGDAGPASLRLAAARLVLPGGVALAPLEVAAADTATPLLARGAADLGGLPATVEAVLPSLDALRAGGPWPVQASLAAEGFTATAEGTLAGPALAGAALHLSLRSADLAALGARARLALPALRDLDAAARLRGEADGWVTLDALTVSSREARGGGTLRLRPDAVPALAARLEFEHLDLDALPPPPLPPAPSPAVAAPAPSAPATPAVPALPSSPRPPARRVIPDLPIPFAVLRGAEADAVLRVASLRAGGADWRDAEATVALRDGRLSAEPVALTGPGGRMTARLGADASSTPPALSLAARGPEGGLDLAPLLAALGMPGGVSGRLEVDADLSGRGDTLRAAAAGLNGTLALAMADGRAENRLLDALLGDMRQFLPRGSAGGSTALRCLALRMRAENGVARAQSMLLDTEILTLLGSGTVDLRDERLDLRLLPRARVGSVALTLPVLLGGTFASPQPRADGRGAGAAAAAILGELAAGGAGNGGAAAEPPGGDCAAQLRVARGGRDGTVPDALPPRDAAPPVPRVGDLLRGLLGR